MIYGELRAYYHRMVVECERWGWDGAAGDAIHSLGNRLAGEGHIPDSAQVQPHVSEYYDVH